VAFWDLQFSVGDMTFKRTALHCVFGVLATAALASVASAAETNQSSGQQTTTPMNRSMNQLLWLKPAAGQPTCPAGQALAVTTNAAGQRTSKPKCMAKPQANGADNR
jgi:hypothetical protein